MDVVFTHGAGLDVQKQTVMAYRVTPDPTGQQVDGLMELKGCRTITADLLAFADWLAAAGMTDVAMESTGEYGKPLDDILEGEVMVFLVNAAHGVVIYGPARHAKGLLNQARIGTETVSYSAWS